METNEKKAKPLTPAQDAFVARLRKYGCQRPERWETRTTNSLLERGLIRGTHRGYVLAGE